MDFDWANIALICLLMGAGVVTFIGVIFTYLAVMEILDTWYLEDQHDQR
jgi:hypothetical protein